MRLFQLTQVAIPEELSSRFTNALLLIEENEEAKLRQESAIYRKDSIKQVCMDKVFELNIFSCLILHFLLRFLNTEGGRPGRQRRSGRPWFKYHPHSKELELLTLTHPLDYLLETPT